MSSIFISYSRKDLAIAEKIVSALAESKLDTWVDWKSIPLGEKFEKEIYQGIEGANVFLFLISPKSVQSEWCKKEIVHATTNNKRIIPIVIQDTEKNLIPLEVSERNWILCREHQDDFGNAIELILKTIHTDYEWVKYHTKLQTQALDWDQNSREDSFLLHGKELEEAEKVFIANLGKEPLPTELQNQFIAQSRVAENLKAVERKKTRKRLRNLGVVIVGITICTIIAIGLATLFGGQVGIARLGEQRANATKQAESTARAEAQIIAINEANARATARAQTESEIRVNRAHQLSNQANAILNDFSQLNLLLLAEAKNSLLPNDPIPGSFYQNIFKSLNTINGIGLGGIKDPSKTYMYYRNGITQSIFSSDGNWLVVTGFIEQDNTPRTFVRIYHLKTFRLDMNFQEYILIDPINLIAITPHGDLIASTNSQTAFWSFDLNSHQSFDTPKAITEEEANQLAINSSQDPIPNVNERNTTTSSDGRIQASIGVVGDINIWKLTDNTLQPYLTITSTDNLDTIRLSPDGQWLIGSRFSEVIIWDLSLPEPAIKQFIIRSSSNFVISPNSQWLATSTPPAGSSIGNINLQVWDLTDLHNFILTSENFTGNINADNLSDFQLSGISYSFHGHESSVLPIQFSPDSEWLLTESVWPDGTIRLWDMNYLNTTALGIWRKGALLGGDFILLGDEQRWLITRKEEIIDLWLLAKDNSFPQYGQTIFFPMTIDVYRYAPQTQRVVFASTSDGQIEIWDFDAKKPTKLQTIKESVTPIESIDISPDGTILIVVGGEENKTIELLYLKDALPKLILGEETNISDHVSYRFSPDSKKLFVTDNTEYIRLWNLETEVPDLVYTEKLNGLEIEDFNFSPDGRWLYFIDSEYRLHLWDEELPSSMETGRTDENIIKVIFSSDSKWLSYLAKDELNQTQLKLVLLGGNLAYDLDIVSSGVVVPSDIMFTPDSKSLVIGNSFESLIPAHGFLVNLENLSSNAITVLEGQNPSLAYARFMKISSDGHWLATVQETTVHVWDLYNTNNPPRVFSHGKEKGITSLDFSDDGKWLATGVAGGVPETVMLWSLSGNPGLSFPVLLNRRATSSLQFLTDEGYLLVDGELLVDLNIERLATIACIYAGRNLSYGEWGSYFPQENYRSICPQILTIPEEP